MLASSNSMFNWANNRASSVFGSDFVALLYKQDINQSLTDPLAN